MSLTIGIRHEVLLITAKPLRETYLDLPDVPAGQHLSPKLAAALAQASFTVDFTDQPLSDVVEYLKAKHLIEIRLDTQALADAGIGSDVPFTMSLKGVTLKSGLELLLGQHDLTCVADANALVIRPSKTK